MALPWEAFDDDDDLDPVLVALQQGRDVPDVATLLAMVELPAWHDRASCRDRPDIDFFSAELDEQHRARELCASCRARRECEAAGADEEYGMWGGRSRRDRTLGAPWAPPIGVVPVVVPTCARCPMPTPVGHHLCRSCERAG